MGGAASMCGIIGHAGERLAAEILVRGLRALEYRGYDSDGGALLDDGNLFVETLAGTAGIDQTRWATHGAPNDLNAHPQLDCSGRVVAIHNSIIENYLSLRRE